MKQGSERPKINHSDKLIEAIQRASSNMNFDEYAHATGLEKEFIFRILKGEIETVDEETLNKLALKH
ncbi:MAG: helix-turn-helix transcriptional regulator [Clostridia bacterium]|nr:helix-turn-helix transcriptional regulator [Clostridia bacterium]